MINTPQQHRTLFYRQYFRKVGYKRAITVKSDIISKVDILNFSEKQQQLDNISSSIRSFKNFKYFYKIKNSSKVSLKSNVNIHKNYKPIVVNYLFLEKLYIQKKLPIFVNFKKYNNSPVFATNDYLKKYTESYNLYRHYKTNTTIFSKLDFEQNIVTFIKNLKYPNFFYTKLNNSIFLISIRSQLWQININ
jgi:hypothetical protein